MAIRWTQIKYSILFSTILSSPSLRADIASDFHVSLQSHYLWRGFDLNDGKATLQGGIDLTSDKGAYIGAWSSQYDFGDNDNGIEVDLYAGYGLELNETTSFDFSITNYQYTGESDSSTEFKIGTTFKFLTLNIHRDIDLKTTYIESLVEYTLSDSIVFSARLGRNEDGTDKYYDYGLAMSYSASDNIEINVAFTDHELGEVGAESTLSAGITGYF